jgi:hypothetical protein
MSLANATSYSVSVQAQPINPAQTCAVNAGSGTISGANVTNISVTCTTNTYSVGGTVNGLLGSGLTLSKNGTETLAISSNGSFTFASPINSSAPYSVTVQTQPSLPGATETCSVTSGAGTAVAAAISSVVVDCAGDALQPPGTTLAISTGATVSLFKVSPTWASAGAAPTAFQVIQTPNITGLAADPIGNIYYTAGDGTAGSDAGFYVCPTPAPGQPYSCHVAPNTTALPGGKLLTFSSGNLLAAQILATGTTIVQFPAAIGPTIQNQTVYTSTGTPADVNAHVISAKPSSELYVTEIPGGSLFGAGIKAFACNAPCSAGSQLDITQSLLAAVGTPAQLSGSMSSVNDFNRLTFGLASGYGAAAAPATLPIALQCGIDLEPPQDPYPYRFSCAGDNTLLTFAQSSTGSSAFVATAGLAFDSNNQLYAGLALTTQGQTIDPSLLTGYGFEGYANNLQIPFGCSSAPTNCPVNLLPPPSIGSAGALPHYLMAMSANCQNFAAGLTTYCGTFKIALTSPSASTSSNTMIGMFWFTTMPIAANYPGPPGLGAAAPSSCSVTILNTPTGQVTTACDASSYYTSSGEVYIDRGGDAITLHGTLSANSVSGTATATGADSTGVGVGTFSGVAVTQ